jgi:hypothetical protein
VEESSPKPTGGAAPQAGNASPEVLYRALLAAVLDPTIAIDISGTIVTASASVE